MNNAIKTLELLVSSHEEQEKRNNLTSSGIEYLKGLKSALKILKESNSMSFSLEDVVEAVQYGFDYSLNSQHDGKRVPIGNTLQWLMSKKDLLEVPKEFEEIKEKYSMNIPLDDLKFIKEHHEKM